jgi:ABC-type transport system involved in multi-copper enzyme maturation permease subunit
MIASIRRISTIAGNAFTDLTRQRVFYFGLIVAPLLIASSIFMARFSFQEEFQILKDVSLGVMSLLTSLLAIAGTARLIPQDIEDRTVYTILAKPVARFEYVLGKLLGVLLLLALGTFLLTALFFCILYVREQSILSETARQMAAAPRDQLLTALNGVRQSAFNGDLVPAIFTIYFKSALLAALTLFVSSFATSQLFTIVVMVFVYFIGHLQGVAREYWLHSQGSGWMAQIFLAVVALVFPDLQSFNLIDDAVAGTAIPLALFAKTALLGFFYTTVYSAFAVVSFSGREL